MTNKTRQAKFAERRKAKKVTIDFYLDDTVERRLYDRLKKEKNIKKLILDYLKELYPLEQADDD